MFIARRKRRSVHRGTKLVRKATGYEKKPTPHHPAAGSPAREPCFPVPFDRISDPQIPLTRHFFLMDTQDAAFSALADPTRRNPGLRKQGSNRWSTGGLVTLKFRVITFEPGCRIFVSVRPSAGDYRLRAAQTLGASSANF
jgi:hypothetical protein